MKIQTKILCWEDSNNEDLGLKDEGQWHDFCFDFKLIKGFYRNSNDPLVPEYFYTTILLDTRILTIQIDFNTLLELYKNETN